MTETLYMPVFRDKVGKRFLINIDQLKLPDSNTAQDAGMCYFEAVMFGATYTGDVYAATDGSTGWHSRISGEFGCVPVFIPDEFNDDYTP